MQTKTIVFTEPNKAELLEEDIRELGKDAVLVKIVISSISNGTERANFIGEANINIYSEPDVVNFPRICGYSSAGIIEQVGENVTEVKVGDRVALSHSIHTKHIVIDKSHVYKIEDEKISFSEAALWFISCFPAAAIRKCHLEFAESAVVMGVGILGMMAVKLLRIAGAAPIVAVDPDPLKREKALDLGADFAFDPFKADFVNKVKKATNGGANVAIEVTGNGKALEQVLDCMKKFGRVALLGCTRDRDFTIDYYRKVHGPGITLIGAHTQARPKRDSFSGWWSIRDEINGIQNLVKCNRLVLSDLVEEMHSPNDAQEVYTRLATDRKFPIVQFNWELIK